MLKGFGVLIKTLVMIISDMKAFIIIMCIVVMGFGSAFVFLLPGVDNDTIRMLVIDVLTGGGEVALIIYSLRDNLDTFSFILVNALFILFALDMIFPSNEKTKRHTCTRTRTFLWKTKMVLKRT